MRRCTLLGQHLALILILTLLVLSETSKFKDDSCAVESRIMLAGVEGSSHHGLLKLLPALKSLATNETDPHCLHLDWLSYPNKSPGLNERARLSLIYGDSCEHNDCASRGKLRCGNASNPKPLHAELVWRFGTFANLEGLGLAAPLGSKILVLRRGLARSTLSHNHDSRRPWDGSYEGHAVVLASFTSIVSLMLEDIPRSQWRTVDPDNLSYRLGPHPDAQLATRTLRALTHWFGWSLSAFSTKDPISDLDLEELLKRTWVESRRSPTKALTSGQHAFIANLEAAARQGEGGRPSTWRLYDDPAQDVLNAFDSSRYTQQRGGVDAATAALGIVQAGQEQPLRSSWALGEHFRGPFPEDCRPPSWAFLDENWPREPGAPSPFLSGIPEMNLLKRF